MNLCSITQCFEFSQVRNLSQLLLELARSQLMQFPTIRLDGAAVKAETHAIDSSTFY